MEENSTIKIGGKAFLFSAAIILALMIVSGVLTKVLPAGTYDRIETEGRTLIVDGSYQEIMRPHYPVWRWFIAPFELLGAPDNLTPIVLLIFIAIVGASIAILESAGVMQALVNLLVSRFSNRKYLLIVILIFFFMFSASFAGVYEEMVPMVVFIVPVAISLGWDTLTGLGMSLLPLSFGFAAAVTNPFTIAIPQRIAELPLFSGSWLRIIFFLVIFCLICVFVIRYAKKVEADPKRSISFTEDQALRIKLQKNNTENPLDKATPQQLRSLVWFASCITLSILIVFATARHPILADLAFPLMAVLFLIGGIGGGIFGGLKAGIISRSFVKGIVNFLPGSLLVLMAFSVRHIISSGMIMDTILFRSAQLISYSPPLSAALLVYAVTLLMNFFVGSASAKAFLMMPLLIPLADLVGITRQTTVMAFNFGDGFSNMIYPTNALLLIALSFTSIGYTKWMRWTWKLQLVILFITTIFVLFAVKINYGPY